MSIPPALIKIGVPALLEGLRGIFSRQENTVAQGAADALGSVLEAMTSGAISPEQAAEMNRHLEALAQMDSDENRTTIEQVNSSLRAEVASEDAYVRRMRPTFGYLMAATWSAQMGAIAYVIIFKTPQAGQVIEAMASLGMIWTVALSVLGIYVYKRSAEKISMAQKL